MKKNIHLMPLFLLAILILNAFSALAQPGGNKAYTDPYSNEYRERVNNAAARDRENFKSTPNKPGTGSTAGMNSKEYINRVAESEVGKAWMELLKKNKKEKTAYQLEQEEKEFKERIKRDSSYALQQRNFIARRDKYAGVISQELDKAGFSEAKDINGEKEAFLDSLTKENRLDPDGEKYRIMTEKANLMVASRIFFNNNFQTASQEDLIDAVSNYKEFYLTATKHFSLIAQRFGEGDRRVDSLRLMSVAYYWGLNDNGIVPPATLREHYTRTNDLGLVLGGVNSRYPQMTYNMLKDYNENYLLNVAYWVNQSNHGYFVGITMTKQDYKSLSKVKQKEVDGLKDLYKEIKKLPLRPMSKEI